MRILIVTPLFPPDTAPSASYTKELSRRLATEHEVTVLLYGRLPEDVPGVKLIAIDKRRLPLFRSWSFMSRLTSQAILSDVVLIQNGPSVELPCLFSIQFKKIVTVLMESDPSALTRLESHPTYTNAHRFLKQKVTATYKAEDLWPIEKPLLHPLKAPPEDKLLKWEQSWNNHLNKLQTLMSKDHD
jgi:hypothetical protein